MDQISRPMQIALLAVVAFAALWFVALRPKTSDTASTKPAAPATASGFHKAVDKAKAAHAAETQAAQQSDAKSTAAASDQTSSPSSTAATPAPATKKDKKAAAALAELAHAKNGAAIGNPPGPVAKGLAKNKVVVMVFYDPGTALDMAVRRAALGVDHARKDVVAVPITVDQLYRYGRVTQGVYVQSTPTIIVVDGKKRATTLTGYTDRETIVQAIKRAERRSKQN